MSGVKDKNMDNLIFQPVLFQKISRFPKEPADH